MSRMRMGQLLEQMGKLSGHDIDEILQEQLSGGPRRSFGEIALMMGFCEPRHIWHAWLNQLADQMDKIDLQALGVDAQAVTMLPRELAARFCAMPVRFIDGELIIALSDPSSAAVFEALGDTLHAHPHFVLADADQIRQMIARYYPIETAAA